MKSVTYADRSLFLDDDTADALLHYAELLMRSHEVDTVDVNAITLEGKLVRAAFLLGESTPLIIESTSLRESAPDNSEALAHLTQRIELLSTPHRGRPDETAPVYLDDFNL